MAYTIHLFIHSLSGRKSSSFCTHLPFVKLLIVTKLLFTLSQLIPFHLWKALTIMRVLLFLPVLAIAIVGTIGIYLTELRIGMFDVPVGTTSRKTLQVQKDVDTVDGPSSSQVFLVWVGSDSLPTMYEVALQSAVKVYGKENITIVSDSLLPAKNWYPKIWNVSSLELALQLMDIRPQSEWNNFFRRLKDPAHHADFLRIALIYLYGGLYTDFDSLWI